MIYLILVITKNSRIIKTILTHILFLTFLLFIAFAPLVKQIANTPKGTFYTRWHGEFPDYYLYLSFIHQGRTEWKLTSTYTTEEKKTTYIHLFYLVAGKLGKLTSLPDIDIYYISIFFSLLLFYFMSFQLIKILIPPIYRWFTMGIIFFASPPPPLTLPFINISIGTGGWTKMDLYSRLTHVPHHFAAIALSLASAYFLIRFYKERKIRFAMFCSLTQILTALFFIIPSLLFFISSLIIFPYFLALKRLKSKKINIHLFLGFVFILMSSIISFVFVYKQLSMAGWSGWEYQHFRPERWPYLFSIFVSSYGILLLFFPFAILLIYKKFRFEYLFIFVSTILPPILYLLSYWGIVPITKIRFMYSVPYVYAGIFSALGLIYILESFGKSKKPLIIGLTLVLYITNITWGLYSYYLPKFIPLKPFQNIYIPEKYLLITNYLSINTPKFSNLLSKYSSAAFIPALTNTKVFAGHPFAYFEHPEKKEILESIYSGKMSTEDFLSVIKKYNLEYVLWEEKELPAQYKNILTEAFKVDNLTIYKVKTYDT